MPTLRRIARYTNALGRFITLDEYFSQTFAPGEHARFLADEYRAPYLKQAVAAGQRDPLSEVARIHRRQAERAAAGAVTTLAQIASGRWTPAADDASEADCLSRAIAQFARRAAPIGRAGGPQHAGDQSAQLQPQRRGSAT